MGQSQFLIGLDLTCQTKWKGIIITNKNGVADSSIQTHLSVYIHANRTWMHTYVRRALFSRSKIQGSTRLLQTGYAFSWPWPDGHSFADISPSPHRSVQPKFSTLALKQHDWNGTVEPKAPALSTSVWLNGPVLGSVS